MSPKHRVPPVPLGKTPLIETPFKNASVDILGSLPRFPEEILTDNGSQFTGKLMKEVYALFNAKHLRSSVYHSQANGLVERFNYTLVAMLKRLNESKPEEWDTYLTAALFAYREVPHASMGYSPYQVIFGSHPGQRRDLTARRAKERALNVGDKALILLPKNTNKLQICWQGPFEVLKKVSPTNYLIKLDDTQTAEIRSLLSQFQDVLSDKPGRTSLELFSMKLLRVKAYPLLHAKDEIVKQEVEELLRAGVIAPSVSPYKAPVQLVRKPDGGHRMCIDFRRLNAIAEFQAEPLPNPATIFAILSHARYFSKFDMSRGYYQIEVDPECRPMLAFCTPQGHY
ncbi:Retrovirus-related Pol polyprotein from transposon 297 [Biomphalaria pfeifferi]|uniref:Retrovirus-related Pol polyprotein from transposon 297 n=1 Tax=Biomphalaria pfeifferi TaxID=112525 RepID=A0AAD8C9H1_BIOPF|nr:Retrovirus-related Pol polyprotein from transposon 297 [Biomphalaria pfeifferi]